MIKTRKLKRVRVSALILTEILKMAASNALPDDAEAHSVYYDHLSNSFDVLASSESFEEITEGQEVPLHGDPLVSTSFLDMIRGRRKNNESI
jgi:hypothetical protein